MAPPIFAGHVTWSNKFGRKPSDERRLARPPVADGLHKTILQWAEPSDDSLDHTGYIFTIQPRRENVYNYTHVTGWSNEVLFNVFRKLNCHGDNSRRRKPCKRCVRYNHDRISCETDISASVTSKQYYNVTMHVNRKISVTNEDGES